MDDVTMGESSRIEELLKRYSSDRSEGSTSFKFQPTLTSVPSTRFLSVEDKISPDKPSISHVENMCTSSVQNCSSSSQNSSSSSLQTSTPCLLSVQSKPPRFAHRFTPRHPKKMSCTLPLNQCQSKTSEKGIQVSLIGNDENIPPGGQEMYTLKKQLKETTDELKTLKKQLKDSVEASALKLKNLTSFTEDLQKAREDIQKEKDYLVRQVQRMQAESSVQAVATSMPNVGMFGNSVTLGDREYDVHKKPIGKGASCVVYRGFDKVCDEMVAIKVVSLQKLNPKDKEEIKREVKLLQSLRNEDCIINLLHYEFKPEKSRLSLILEYGEIDLNAYLQQTPCLEKSPNKRRYYEVCLLWHQMLQSVHCIHSHNIVHKDLKPQNFLKVKGKLKLIDFGISQQISDEVTSMIIVQPEGTPNYIAPEMLCGSFGTADCNILSYRSDVFSLGCILFKMCYGVTPYQHIEKMQMKYLAIISEDPIHIPETLPFPDIIRILGACLNKDRQKRPNVAELLDM